MEEIVLATRNKHKISEMTAILKGLGIKLLCAYDFPHIPEVEEDGKTLEANAAKKARVVARYSKKWALADDTGLEVKHINGEPGVYSARWAGEGCSYADNNNKMLKAMKGVPKQKRTAVFRTVVALSSPGGKVFSVDGVIKGYISDKIRGAKGFGYDPLFIVPKYNKTYAELSTEIKNEISHRAKALSKAKKLIKEIVSRGKRPASSAASK